MTDVSPVTESEMKQFFDRIATTFVGLSAQSHELDRIKAEMEAMNQRLNTMATDNANLRKEISDTYELVSGVERERDEAKWQVLTVETQNDYLRGENVRKDQAIANLESEVRRLTDSVAVANRETLAATTQVNHLGHELDKAKQSRDYHRSRAEQAEAEVKATQENANRIAEANTTLANKLETVQAKLSEVSSLFANPVPEPVEPPIGSASREIDPDSSQPHTASKYW